MKLLEEIKSNENLKHIPVAVFTTSRSHGDILRTYGLGGTLFITKPLGFHEFMVAVQSIMNSLLCGKFIKDGSEADREK
jgi:CheY-like chemotaxis protein